MKKIFLFYLILSSGVFFVFIPSCKKDKGSIPVVTTNEVYGITQTSAIGGGNVTDNGGGTVSEYGVCWNTNPYPTIDNNKTSLEPVMGSFTCNFYGLSPNTVYYIRAYATNKAGTGYGDNVIFPTSGTAGPTVSDIDGNVYKTIYIGTRLWMAENLKVTHYNNGDSIPNVKAAQWANQTTGAYHNCVDDTSYVKTYGRLYNWYAVSDTRGIAPIGWHIPTDPEFTGLADYLGGQYLAGGRLKESGNAHWNSPNTAADNCSGFTGLPAGYIKDEQTSCLPGYFGRFWSRTWTGGTNSYSYSLSSNNGYFLQSQAVKAYGYSVRCVKD